MGPSDGQWQRKTTRHVGNVLYLIEVLVRWVYSIIETYLAKHLKSIHFIVSQLKEKKMSALALPQRCWKTE